MKPLKLTMTAFGPYKYTEVIDFTDLEDNKLFVISGNTGSGKTTIFDGISFALYGSASGADRENNTMLRSDFAADDTHTSVELEFEINGRIYRILRQLGHVKQGNKSKTGERYEFYEKIQDKEIPCVDRQIVSEIDRKVEEIIGLTKDQFKQIVMLPQGEFRKLLTSETENKEAILRRIFRTGSYQEINEILREKKQTEEQDFKQAEHAREQYISSISSLLPYREDSLLFQVLSQEHYNVNQILEGISREEAYYREQIIQDKQHYEKAFQMHNQKQEEYHQAKGLNDKFKELEEKSGKLHELEENVPKMKQLEEQLDKAMKASAIEVYEKRVLELRREEKEKADYLTKAKDHSLKANESLLQAEANYKHEENKRALREETAKTLDELNRFLPEVKDMERRKEQINKLTIEGKYVRKELDQAAEKLAKIVKEQETLNQELLIMDREISELPAREKTLTKLREQAKVLKRYLELSAKHNELMKQKQTIEIEFKDTQNRYQEIESKWLNNQAVQLAAHLHDGEACPVCGSLEHPARATHDDGEVKKEELEALRNERDKKERSYQDITVDWKANYSQLKDKEEELVEFGLSKDSAASDYDRIVLEGKEHKKQVGELEKKSNLLREGKVSLEKLENEIKQWQSHKEEKEKAYQEKQLDYRSRIAVYHDRLEKIPEEMRDLTKLEKKINQKAEEKEMLEKAWENVQKHLQEAKEAKTKAASNVEFANKQLDEVTAKWGSASELFKLKYLEAGFSSAEEYQEARYSESDQQKLKERIQRFNEELRLVKQQVTDLTAVLHGKEKTNLEKLHVQLDELKNAYEAALNQWKRSKDYFEDIIKIKDNIIESDETAKEKEKSLATITDLYNVLRGQNDKKISFERYLQIEYLEQIIEAANSRLRNLSNGQFYLIRSDRQEVRGKQSGLGLDVYDTYTGQTRDVKTLSGGEKFTASLCLALGMSDVIQSFQGNIKIDTMFIDEGFGSLDEESLHKAIDALIEIQRSGRMIGVISHVQDLKNMFPAILEVKKTKEGHSRTAFVLK
ncbi:SMC family ATPase [Oceanobacillus piezotolerans]|uniref:Nuclease SbcCD subunit C n=1 Tax=Oceanobacillus piezotolerans TaxID=2448030 RepID=A0A498D8F4_9BACI|nr:AAA family ATPase [Oceanobacillus piezotolerans]RLL45117.1 SMC family ATPase [Oceanobacillus piezotolerans]